MLASSSYCYQKMDQSLFSVRKDFNHKKTHAAYNNRVVKKFTRFNDQLNEVELVKLGIAIAKLIFLGLFQLAIFSTENVAALLRLIHKHFAKQIIWARWKRTQIPSA